MSLDRAASMDWAPVRDADSPAPGRLVSFSMPAPGLTVDNFLEQAAGLPRFFWQRGGDEQLFAGFGTAVQLIAWGENRFQEIRRKAAALFENAQILGEHSAPILPRLFGGFSFRDDFAPDKTWAVFHPAQFVLPHYQLVQKGASSWLTINALAGGAEDRSDMGIQLRLALEARYAALLENEAKKAQPYGHPDLENHYPMSYAAWTGLIERAVQDMGNSPLMKVVLARVCEIRSKRRIDVCRTLTYLNDQFEDCTRFLFEPRPYHAFYGATPELLVKTEGETVTTMALAGSMPRGQTGAEADAYARSLLNSAKERHEHQLVVEAIRRRLEPITAQLQIPAAPHVYRLSYIQHLLTPISGTLRRPEGILPLVQLLHPTPAMGGSPRDTAMNFISKYEPVPRGWYAAPVGWLDSRMDGEFVVAIRAAIAQDRRVWCYAGAGIVPNSQPDVEWAETDLKFRPMLRALESAATVGQ